MHCDLQPGTGATIMRPATALHRLPPASQADFGGRPPWAVITTRTLVAALHLDRGLWATWRCRGIGPAELPASWFRPASGRPCYYRVDTVLTWIAARRGEPFDPAEAYRSYLITAGLPPDPVWAKRLAESEGPAQGEVRFTPDGWKKYLDSLIL